MPVVEIHHLTKDYGSVRAVDDLSFTISAGTIVGFLGPNGSGKTTTLRTLLGLVKPTAGSATIAGRAYRELRDPLRQVGVMLEAAGHPGHTARDHLRVQAAEARVPSSRVDALLDLVELRSAAHRRLGGFSLGMRQRLGLAGALIGDPGTLVLDEPANGLDPEGIRWLRDFLRSLAADGRTVLLSSHVLAEVAQTVDQVVVINAGRLVLHAPLSQLMAAGEEKRIRVRAAQRAALATVLKTAGLVVADDDAGAITVTGSSQEAIAQLAFDRGIVLYEIATQTSSLEETFLSLTNAADIDAADKNATDKEAVR